MRPKRLKLSAFGPYASVVELDMEKLGMKTVLETKKYGGKRRYVMSKTLEY